MRESSGSSFAFGVTYKLRIFITLYCRQEGAPLGLALRRVRCVVVARSAEFTISITHGITLTGTLVTSMVTSPSVHASVLTKRYSHASTERREDVVPLPVDADDLGRDALASDDEGTQEKYPTV